MQVWYVIFQLKVLAVGFQFCFISLNSPSFKREFCVRSYLCSKRKLVTVGMEEIVCARLSFVN